jgi:acyl-CoA synthetase (AMP-forming)/AMP-acid ligase II
MFAKQKNRERNIMPDFVALDALVGRTATIAPDRIAVIDGERQLSYAALDDLIDRVAAALQADGLQPRDVVSICALSSIEYVAAFLGALRAGVAVAPLAPSSTPHDFAAMVKDSGAKILFMDQGTAAAMGASADAPLRVSLDDSAWGRPFDAWCAAPGTRPKPLTIDPEWTFNIIYSSGTTGTPKGIVHSHFLRWCQYGQLDPLGYGADAVTVLSTPLYSNTTLVCFNPTIAGGGTVVLMEEIRCPRFPRTERKASRHPYHAGAGAISPHHGAARLRALRPVVVPDEVLHLGAVRGRPEGRYPEALARRPDRILRHDRGRRRLRAAGA